MKNWQKHGRARLTTISGNEWSVPVKFRSNASRIFQAKIIPELTARSWKLTQSLQIPLD